MGPGRRVFAVAFVVCWAVGAAWALASPLYSGPDEAAHLFRAYAIADGTLIGDDAPFREGIIGQPTYVDVPRSLVDPGRSAGCFVRQPQVPAECADGGFGRGTIRHETGAGRNPPLYHLLVAPPVRIWPDALGFYLARLVGAAVSAALLAGAVTLAWTRRRAGVLVGALVACTPMAWFLAGVLNTSSMEISGAVATWVGGVALLDDWRAGRRAGGGALAVLVTGGVALAQGRGLGPLWVGVVGLALVAGALGDGTLRRLLEDRRAQLAAGAVGLAAVANLVWVVATGSLEGSGHQQDLSLLQALKDSWFHQTQLWRTAFDTFGWFDAVAPVGVAVTWIGCGLVLVLVALAAARLRAAALLVGVAVAAVVVPIVVEASQRPELGSVWQGRYSLPLLGGIPIVAGWVLDRERERLPVAPRLLALVAAAATLAHVAGYWTALRRYAVGTEGSLWFLDDHTWLRGWLIPVTLGGVLAVVALGAGAGWGAVRFGRAPAATEPDGTATG